MINELQLDICCVVDFVLCKRRPVTAPLPLSKPATNINSKTGTKLRFSGFKGMALLPENISRRIEAIEGCPFQVFVFKCSTPSVRKERSDHFARPITSAWAGDRDFPNNQIRIGTPLTIDRTTEVPSLPPMRILASDFGDNDTPRK